MTNFIIKKLPYDLTSNAGLALVGQYMKRLGISARVDRKFPVGIGGIANSDILKSYLDLLVQGKNDFDAIEEFRGDDFFTRALDVGTVPSSRPCASAWTPMRPRGLSLAPISSADQRAQPLQKRLGTYLSRIRHVQKLTDPATMVYRGTRILRFEGYEAWSRTKFETKLDINEKIKKIIGGWGIVSRIQEEELNMKII